MDFNRKSSFNRSGFNRGHIPSIYTTILSLVYSGDIAVGETVCIDTNYFSVKLNSANSISKFDGDFPEVIPLPYKAIYSDDESDRTVEITVSWRDRKL